MNEHIPEACNFSPGDVQYKLADFFGNALGSLADNLKIADNRILSFAVC